jgi:hypothetical protein
MKKYMFNNNESEIIVERGIYELLKDRENSVLLYPDNPEITRRWRFQADEFKDSIMSISEFLVEYNLGRYVDNPNIPIKQVKRLVCVDYLKFAMLDRKNLHKAVRRLGVDEVLCMCRVQIFDTQVWNSLGNYVSNDKLQGRSNALELLRDRVRRFKSVNTNFDNREVEKLIEGLSALHIEDAHEYIYNYTTDTDVIDLTI